LISRLMLPAIAMGDEHGRKAPIIALP
jgi:hypothetical protein